jgi:F0F1-type ATP synthase epsilon subunit
MKEKKHLLERIFIFLGFIVSEESIVTIKTKFAKFLCEMAVKQNLFIRYENGTYALKETK